MSLQYHVRSKYFDNDFDPRQQLACRFLDQALDDWCRDPHATSRVRGMAAVLLRMFSATRRDIEGSWSHSVDDWLHQVEEPQRELLDSWPKRPDSEREAALDDLLEILRSGIGSWEESDLAEQQSAEEMAQRFVDELVTHGLLVIHHG